MLSTLVLEKNSLNLFNFVNHIFEKINLKKLLQVFPKRLSENIMTE